MTVDDKVFVQDLSQWGVRWHHQVWKSARYVRAQRMMCTTQACVWTSSLVYCALHVIVRVHVIPLCDDAAVGLTLGLIAVVVIVVFVVAILHEIFLSGRHTLHNNNTAEVPSVTLRTALSAIPFVSDLCGVDVQCFQERFSQALPNSKELSV